MRYRPMRGSQAQRDAALEMGRPMIRDRQREVLLARLYDHMTRQPGVMEAVALAAERGDMDTATYLAHEAARERDELLEQLASIDNSGGDATAQDKRGRDGNSGKDKGGCTGCP